MSNHRIRILSSLLIAFIIINLYGRLSKTPFISTDVGNAKEIIRWSNAGMLLPTIKNKNGHSFADINKSALSLETIYNNSKKRKTMAQNGYNAWKKRFTWDKIAKQYEQVYQNIIT